MGEWVAVAAGVTGVAVEAGVSVEYCVGGRLAVAVGVVDGCTVTQAVASSGRTVSRRSFFMEEMPVLYRMTGLFT